MVRLPIDQRSSKREVLFYPRAPLGGGEISLQSNVLGFGFESAKETIGSACRQRLAKGVGIVALFVVIHQRNRGNGIIPRCGENITNISGPHIVVSAVGRERGSGGLGVTTIPVDFAINRRKSHTHLLYISGDLRQAKFHSTHGVTEQDVDCVALFTHVNFGFSTHQGFARECFVGQCRSIGIFFP